MDTLRDLARVDPWRESLERSRARRRSSGDPGRRRAAGGPADRTRQARELPPYWRLCWRALAKRWITLVTAAAGLLTLVLLASTRPMAAGGHDVQASAMSARTGLPRGAGRSPVGAGSRGGTGLAAPRTCEPGGSSHGYVNPLAGASAVARRIDQGVDYAGSGTLAALGTARISHLATVDTGWPGAFIEYQLLSGPEAGCYVYYAEGVTPAPGLHVGAKVRAGQAIASIVPNSSSGIELGWGAGDGAKSYAAKVGEWSAAHEANDIPSAAGLYFSALIASLGGPPGRVEG